MGVNTITASDRPFDSFIFVELLLPTKTDDLHYEIIIGKKVIHEKNIKTSVWRYHQQFQGNIRSPSMKKNNRLTLMRAPFLAFHTTQFKQSNISSHSPALASADFDQGYNFVCSLLSHMYVVFSLFITIYFNYIIKYCLRHLIKAKTIDTDVNEHFATQQGHEC